MANIHADPLEEHIGFRIRVLVSVEDVASFAGDRGRERGDDALLVAAGDQQGRDFFGRRAQLRIVSAGGEQTTGFADVGDDIELAERLEVFLGRHA